MRLALEDQRAVKAKLAEACILESRLRDMEKLKLSNKLLKATSKRDEDARRRAEDKVDKLTVELLNLKNVMKSLSAELMEARRMRDVARKEQRAAESARKQAEAASNAAEHAEREKREATDRQHQLHLSLCKLRHAHDKMKNRNKSKRKERCDKRQKSEDGRRTVYKDRSELKHERHRKKRDGLLVAELKEKVKELFDDLKEKYKSLDFGLDVIIDGEEMGISEHTDFEDDLTLPVTDEIINDKLAAYANLIDRGLLSRSTYQRLTEIDDDMPKYHAVRKRLHKLAEEAKQNFGDIVDEDSGNFVWLHPSKVADFALNSAPEGSSLLFQGDGKNIDRRHASTGFNLKAIHFDLETENREDLLPIGLTRCKEDTEELRKQCSSMFEKLEDLKENLYISADLKFLKVMFALHEFNGEEACCPWCTAKRKDRLQINSEFRIEEDRYQTTNNRKGQGIMDFISPKHVMVDVLHLLLRITDKLLHEAFADAFRLWRTEKAARDAIEGEIKSINGLGHFRFFLRVKPGSSQSDYAWTSFNSPERLRLLLKADASKFFPQKASDLKTAARRALEIKKLQEMESRKKAGLKKKQTYGQKSDVELSVNACGRLGTWTTKKWRQFHKLYLLVNSYKELELNGRPIHPEQYGQLCRAWVKSLIKTSPNQEFGYSATVVTPYLHVFSNHVWEMAAHWGGRGLKHFSCSGTERQNLYEGRHVRRANSRRTKSELVEVFMARLRLLVNKAKFVPVKYECKFCHAGFKKRRIDYMKHLEICAEAHGEPMPTGERTTRATPQHTQFAYEVSSQTGFEFLNFFVCLFLQ